MTDLTRDDVQAQRPDLVAGQRKDDHPGHAVEAGELRYVSVSQIQQFDDRKPAGCERRWFFEKVRRIRLPDTIAQAGGKEVHAQVEHYLRTGEDVLGIVAAQGRRFIPKPHPDFLIEHPIGSAEAVRHFEACRRSGTSVYEDERFATVLSAHEIPFIGYIDLVNPTGYWLDDEGDEHDDGDTTIEVVDWKTSSNVAKYGKTAAELSRTHQMVAYAEWATRAFKDVEAVRVSHGTVQTRGRAARKETVRLPVVTVHERWQDTVSVVGRMRQVARDATKPEDVRPNLTACTAYSGCPHRPYCPKAPTTTRDLFTNGAPRPMSLMDRLNKKPKPETQDGQGGRSTPEGHKPPAASAPAQGDVAAEVEKLKAEERGEVPPAPKPTDVVPPDAPRSGEKSAAAKPLDDPSAASKELRDAEAQTATGKPKRERRGAVKVEGEHVTPEVRARAAELADKDGKPEVAAGIRAGAEEERTPSARPAEEPKEAVIPPQSIAGLVLIVDCHITGCPAYNLDTYIRECADVLCREFGAADLECAPADSPLGFGKWRGALRSYIKEHPPAMGVWAVNFVTDSPRRQVAVEAVGELAKLIIRGVR